MAGTTEGDTFCYWQRRADWFSKNTSSGTSLLRAGDRCIKTSTVEEEHLSQALLATKHNIMLCCSGACYRLEAEWQTHPQHLWLQR